LGRLGDPGPTIEGPKEIEGAKVSAFRVGAVEKLGSKKDFCGAKGVKKKETEEGGVNQTIDVIWGSGNGPT